MMKRSLTMIAALGLLASLAGVAPTQAASVTYTSTTIADTPVPFSSSVSVSKFNTSLGTLTGISFTVYSDITAVVKVVNISGSDLTFTNAYTSDTVTVTGPAGLSFSSTPTAMVASGTAYGNPIVTSFSGIKGSTSSTKVYTGSFAPYEGAGSAMVSLGFAGGKPTSGGTGENSEVFFGGSAAAGGYVKVTYTYTPSAVPEPTSMALLGIGMTSFLAFRRFFKRTPVA